MFTAELHRHLKHEAPLFFWRHCIYYHNVCQHQIGAPRAYNNCTEERNKTLGYQHILHKSQETCMRIPTFMSVSAYRDATLVALHVATKVRRQHFPKGQSNEEMANVFQNRRDSCVNGECRKEEQVSASTGVRSLAPGICQRQQIQSIQHKNAVFGNELCVHSSDEFIQFNTAFLHTKCCPPTMISAHSWKHTIISLFCFIPFANAPCLCYCFFCFNIFLPQWCQ